MVNTNLTIADAIAANPDAIQQLQNIAGKECEIHIDANGKTNGLKVYYHKPK